VANVNQLKSMLKSHVEGDDERFYAIAMQMAAHEAKIGNRKLAKELRDLIDQAKARRDLTTKNSGGTVPNGMPQASWPKHRLGEMVLDEHLDYQLKRVIREQRQAARLLAHGLSPRRKLLLMGAPGTGKASSGSVLAGELGLPLFHVRTNSLGAKCMEETVVRLRQVFDATDRTRGVYFFDEFDAICSQRDLENGACEIRQMIEQDKSHSLIVAAVNYPEILDHSLLWRFDDVLDYELVAPA